MSGDVSGTLPTGRVSAPAATYQVIGEPEDLDGARGLAATDRYDFQWWIYHSPGWNKDYPKIQILKVEEILAGKTVDLPPNIQTFKKGERLQWPPLIRQR